MAGNKTVPQRLKEIENNAFTPAYITAIDGDIPSSGLGTHAAVDLETYSMKSVFVRTSSNCNVYFQTSYDGVDWATIVDTDGGTAGFDETVLLAVDTDAKCIPVNVLVKYFRVIVDNQEAEACTTKVVIMVK